ncbi:hypothetical protein FCK90_12810 [Kocuria coralli]|uniref:Carboxypeptidase regulatory-like domain-containing protein n=1 Tax=Kocuria coralli TaxID=1461025 RepID=A0A5J5KWJ0_9MICC|nr:hypothetical protein [Kocuria coralli]KAA9393265.1 hypothetical protein FCK90_12810 [Kocuria coralli]
MPSAKPRRCGIIRSGFAMLAVSWAVVVAAPGAAAVETTEPAPVATPAPEVVETAAPQPVPVETAPVETTPPAPAETLPPDPGATGGAEPGPAEETDFTIYPGESASTSMLFVGTIVGQELVEEPTVTLTDSETHEELGTAYVDETGSFNVAVPSEDVAEVESMGVTVKGHTREGEPITVESGEVRSEDQQVKPSLAARDSLLVMVDPAETPADAPMASMVLGSESSALIPGQTWTDEETPQERSAAEDAEILEPQASAESRLAMTRAGANPVVIIGAGLVAVASLAWAMVVAGRRRRS